MLVKIKKLRGYIMETRYDRKIQQLLGQYQFLSGKKPAEESDVEKRFGSIKPERQDFKSVKLYVAFFNVYRAVKEYYRYYASYNTRNEAVERAFMEWNQCRSELSKIERFCQNTAFNAKMCVLKAFARIH